MEKDKKQSTNMPESPEQTGGTTTQQLEDAALKNMMQFFADELLPYLGIQGKVTRIAPTELVHLEVRKLFEDFNLEMEDGSWTHFEFQSKNEGLKGLKRFRTYEALASYQHNVSITTYVLFSGNIKHPMTEFTEGINTYRVQPIIMSHRNADRLIRTIRKKIESAIPLTKADLIPLVLSPLMSGKSSLPERIRVTFRAIRQADKLTSAEKKKMEAVVYAMAEKFLEKDDFDEIGKEIQMTRLGQMMIEEGIQKGEARVNQLNQQLIQANRTEDIIKATLDKEYQDKLYKEFGL